MTTERIECLQEASNKTWTLEVCLFLATSVSVATRTEELKMYSKEEESVSFLPSFVAKRLKICTIKLY